MLDIPEKIKENVGRGDSLFKTLNYVHETYKGKDIRIVELGTTRGELGGGPMGDGWASILWAWYAGTWGGWLYTVDIDENCLEECRKLTEDNHNVHYINMHSLDYLSKFKSKIHLLYLDSAFDPDLMLREFLAAEPLLDDSAYVLLDDVGHLFKRGKGTILGPFLMNHKDFELVYHDTNIGVNQALFKKKEENND